MRAIVIIIIIIGIILIFSISFCDCVDFWEFLFGPKLGRKNSYEEATQQQLNIDALVKSFSYHLETHDVKSETGHILTIHRLLSPGKNKSQSILIHHGFLGSSDMWLFRGPKKDLPYILLDAGYDVWLMNARGNIYSRKHEYLNPDNDVDYWEFGIHELGFYDLPAVIDHIINVTRNKNLYFLSHSMGASAGLVMCSLKPEYNKKIRLFIALAPLTYVTHKLTSIHKFVFSSIPHLGKILKEKNIYEIFPRRNYFTNMLEIFCHYQMPTQKLCLSTMFLAVGKDYKQFNTTMFPQIIKYYPAGTSIRLIQNLVQYYLSGDFNAYDYGDPTINYQNYNSTLPESYNLTKVTAPISLHYGDGDVLVTSKDINKLASRLPNVVGKFVVPYKNFNHLDFVFAIDSKTLLYESLINLINKYNS